MLEGQFDLRGWENSVIDEESHKDEEVISPVLGLIWDRKQDTLGISLNFLDDINIVRVTKRQMLSVAHRLFDPIGFSCPVQLTPRLLLRATSSVKLKWDDEVAEDIGIEFLAWVKQLLGLRELQIPRWLTRKDLNNKTLHMFCDASKLAYAAAVYLRTESDTRSEVNIQLIQAKNRIVPDKELSIPRLELLAATIGARLVRSVLEALGETNMSVFCWTDSSTVLFWIKREDIWKPFVWNRVQEIRSLTDKDQWFFTPGSMNIADVASRGCSVKLLLQNKWWEGPVWLENKNDWPKQDFKTCEEEIRHEKRKEVITQVGLNEKKDFTSMYAHFSSYQKVLNQLAWTKRFIGNCRFPQNKKKGCLSLDEIDEAETILLRLIQEEVFEGINDKRISTLCPVVDDKGLIRIKTKLTERDDLYDFIYPILLPEKHPVVEKIIWHYHRSGCHVGVQGLISLVREKFWVIRTRKAVRGIIRKCVKCQRYRTKKLSTEAVALPKDRVKDAKVFEVVGIDLTGPLYVKGKDKVWVCIFTCAVYRAVHLEIVKSMSTEAFLLAFRRFIARRGRPSVVYSDNGRNFVGAENALKASNIDWNVVEQEGISQRIRWKFSPPSAAWWGGWWERLIQVLKQLLRRQLGRATLTYDELSALICECEALMNSRPLTYVSEDRDALIPLTPAMFLNDVQQIGTVDLDKIEEISPNRHLRYLQRLRQELRVRFRKEYLGQLALPRQRSYGQKLEKGTIVLVEKENCRRFDWPLGIIEKLIAGKDGRVRLVEVRTAAGVLKRPIQRIYPLEVEETLNINQENDGPETDKKTLSAMDDEPPQAETTNDSEPSTSRGTVQVDSGMVVTTCDTGSEPVREREVRTRYGRVVRPPERLTYD